MLIKKSMFDRWEEDWKVMLKDMYEETAADRNRVVIPVLEEQGVCHDGLDLHYSLHKLYL